MKEWDVNPPKSACGFERCELYFPKNFGSSFFAGKEAVFTPFFGLPEKNRNNFSNRNRRGKICKSEAKRS